MAKFDYNSFYYYEISSFFWFENEIKVGFSAIENLIDNQEKKYSEEIEKFEEWKNEQLKEVPEEYEKDYYMQFIEHRDMVLIDLKKIQRGSVCLTYYSFLEGSLLKLISIVEGEFKITAQIDNRNILKSIYKFFINDIGIDKTSIEPIYTKIKQQIQVRNDIAHNHSNISDIKKFIQVEGIKLIGASIVIYDVIYLKNLIKLGDNLLINLIKEIDLKYKSLKQTPTS